jgi:hypothetical protein
MTQKGVINDEAVTGSKHFFCYFWYFWKVRKKKSQGYTFVENVKKVQNQPTLFVLLENPVCIHIWAVS